MPAPNTDAAGKIGQVENLQFSLRHLYLTLALGITSAKFQQMRWRYKTTP